jgi:hypothetical protein
MMKNLLFLSLLLMSILGYSQTVAEKPEFIKFMNYCQVPVERQFTMRGEVSLVKYNPDYTNTTTYYAQPVTGDWMAKYPLIIKWYPVDVKNTIIEPYQYEIIAYFKVMVPRVYCPNKTEYLALFRAHWKNGDIQSGWADAHFIGWGGPSK